MPAPKRTPALFRKVVEDYVLTGNLAEVARRNDLQANTPVQWRKRYPADWADTEHELVAAMTAETKARVQRNLNKALVRIEERLEHGDVVALKGGRTIAVPVRARDLSLIFSQLFDKLRLIEGKATKITQGETKVSQLLNEFKAMGQAYRTGTVLEGISSAVHTEGEEGGSLKGAGEGQKPQPQNSPNPPSPGTAPAPMPHLLQYKATPSPLKGRVKQKIEDYKDSATE